MWNKEKVKILAAAGIAFTISAAVGFGAAVNAYGTETVYTEAQVTEEQNNTANGLAASEDGDSAAAGLNMVSGGALDTTDLFTSRDLEQTADLSEAKSCTVSDGQTIEITSKGVYVITGSAANAQNRSATISFSACHQEHALRSEIAAHTHAYTMRTGVPPHSRRRLTYASAANAAAHARW